MKIHNQFYQDLEKKFSIFRWVLICMVPPMTISLSDYNTNTFYILIAIILACIYNAFVTIAAYSKKLRFHSILKYTIYFDIPFISLLIFIRGGLRSDIYLIYYLIILYSGAKFGFRGTLNSLIQTVFFYSVITFYYFHINDEYDINRYIIRVIYLATMSFVMYEVNRQITESRTKEKIARDLAQKDPLTQLPNRLLMSENFERLRQIYEERARQFAIVALDIDNFKNINDSKGHSFGDQALLTLAQILTKNISEQDFVCRFGGDEFLAFFAYIDKDKAMHKANKILEEIANYDFNGVSFTVSIGVNMFKNDLTMIENINCADEALYDAKNKGKNLVVLYDKL